MRKCSFIDLYADLDSALHVINSEMSDMKNKKWTSGLRTFLASCPSWWLFAIRDTAMNGKLLHALLWNMHESWFYMQHELCSIDYAQRVMKKLYHYMYAVLRKKFVLSSLSLKSILLKLLDLIWMQIALDGSKWLQVAVLEAKSWPWLLQAFKKWHNY